MYLIYDKHNKNIYIYIYNMTEKKEISIYVQSVSNNKEELS